MSDEATAKPDRSPDAQAMALEVRRLAHELNNVLMPIMLGIETLRRKAPDPALDRTFGNMDLSVKRANELTNELLRLGRG